MTYRKGMVRIFNWLAGSIAMFVAVLFPLVYCYDAYHFTAGNIEVEAEINSRIISGFINANPRMWQFEQMRLEEVLGRRPRSGEKEVRRIVDLQGRVVAESSDRIPPPLLTRSHDLKDSGATVGRLDISRSLRPLLAGTVLYTACGILLGLLVFLAIRILPFRALVRAESARRESDERFRKIFELSPLGIAIMGLDCRFSTVNGMFRKMLGYTDDDLETLKFSDVIHPDDARDPQMPLTEGLPAFQNESRYVRKDGTCLWGRLLTTTIHDENTGNPLCYFVMLEDVTENRELGSQLRQSQKMEAVGRLAGGVAHDFNNILTVIIGLASLMQMKMQKDHGYMNFVNQIIASAEKAADLTRGLLAFSRKQLIQPHPVDLNHIVNSTRPLLARLIPEDIELHTCLTGEELIVMADPSQIDQILLNMIANARDAMPNGGVLTIGTSSVRLDELRAKVDEFDATGRFAMLEISDTGSGMDETTKSLIFDPFFTTKEVGKGTGLGLAISYGIVQQHNGYIGVESEAGQGTTFRIYLPLIQGEAISPRGAEVMGNGPGGSETILIVEDNQDVRHLTKTIIEQNGYRVIEAMDGQDAVHKFRKHRDSVNLVIMDVIMPKMNGKEACNEIEKICPDAKVLFISGYTASIISEKGRSMMETHFLSKPARPQELLRKIREMLHGA